MSLKLLFLFNPYDLFWSVFDEFSVQKFLIKFGYVFFFLIDKFLESFFFLRSIDKISDIHIDFYISDNSISIFRIIKSFDFLHKFKRRYLGKSFDNRFIVFYKPKIKLRGLKYNIDLITRLDSFFSSDIPYYTQDLIKHAYIIFNFYILFDG